MKKKAIQQIWDTITKKSLNLFELENEFKFEKNHLLINFTDKHLRILRKAKDEIKKSNEIENFNKQLYELFLEAKKHYDTQINFYETQLKKLECKFKKKDFMVHDDLLNKRRELYEFIQFKKIYEYRYTTTNLYKDYYSTKKSKNIKELDFVKKNYESAIKELNAFRKQALKKTKKNNERFVHIAQKNKKPETKNNIPKPNFFEKCVKNTNKNVRKKINKSYEITHANKNDDISASIDNNSNKYLLSSAVLFQSEIDSTIEFGEYYFVLGNVIPIAKNLLGYLKNKAIEETKNEKINVFFLYNDNKKLKKIQIDTNGKIHERCHFPIFRSSKSYFTSLYASDFCSINEKTDLGHRLPNETIKRPPHYSRYNKNAIELSPPEKKSLISKKLPSTPGNHTVLDSTDKISMLKLVERQAQHQKSKKPQTQDKDDICEKIFILNNLLIHIKKPRWKIGEGWRCGFGGKKLRIFDKDAAKTILKRVPTHVSYIYTTIVKLLYIKGTKKLNFNINKKDVNSAINEIQAQLQNTTLLYKIFIFFNFFMMPNAWFEYFKIPGGRSKETQNFYNIISEAGFFKSDAEKRQEGTYEFNNYCNIPIYEEALNNCYRINKIQENA